jgi:hypothetical protein
MDDVVFEDFMYLSDSNLFKLVECETWGGKFLLSNAILNDFRILSSAESFLDFRSHSTNITIEDT